MKNLALWNGTKWWVQRTIHKFAAGVGLLIILGGILYLLSGFSAALDAISFQDRVLRVVGDDNRMQARSVLNKLDQLRRSEPSNRPRDAEDLPIETLALQLDRVKVVTHLLGSFEKAIVMPDVPANRTEIQSKIVESWLKTNSKDLQPEQKQKGIIRLLQELKLVDENEIAKTNTEDLMLDLGNNLRNELRQLDIQISDNVRGIKLVRSLDRIQSVLDQITSNKENVLVRSLDDIQNVLEEITSDNENVSTSTGDGSANPEETHEVNLQVDEFKEQLDQLEIYLLQLGNIMPSLDTEGVSESQYFDSAIAAINEIKPLTNGSAKLIQSNLEKIFILLETIKTNVGDIKTIIAEPKPEALDYMVLKLKANAEKINGSGAIDDSTRPQSSDPLGDFRKQTTELEDHINTTLPEIETIRKITPALAQMEIASNALSRLVVDSERISTVIDGQSVAGFEAANIYDKQVEALSEAVASMTRSLTELSDEGLLAQLLTDDSEAMAKADTLLRDHEKISRPEFPLSIRGWTLIDPAVLAVASREKLDIMMVLIVGAIGSMIYMTQRMLKMFMHGQADDVSQRMPFLWYLARPVFGAVVAFSVYLIYQTGQIALGTGGLTEVLENGVNIPILTVIGLFAGLLSWQALEMIQSKGEVWLKSGTPEPLWATGLARVLEAKDQTEESCSQHLGVTIGQIDRWICYKDKVVPEMQDRLSTWLGVKSEDLFSATALVRTQNQTPLYAIGLKPFLQRIEAHQTPKTIALALGVKVEIVERWRDQKQPVSSEYQWQLVDLVKDRFALFFATKAQTDQNWAVRLRESMSKSQYHNSTTLASKLNINEEWVKKWRDLYEPVPAPTARLIAETLQDDVNVLFDSQYDRLSDQFFAANPALEQAIVKRYVSEASADPSADLKKAVSAFSIDMDVSENWVNDWLKGRKPLFAPTRSAAAIKLGKDEDTLFKNYAVQRAPEPEERTPS